MLTGYFRRSASLRGLGNASTPPDRSVFALYRMSNSEPPPKQLALIVIHAYKAQIPSYFAWLWGFCDPFFSSLETLASAFWGVAILESPTAAVYCGVFRVAEDVGLIVSSGRARLEMCVDYLDFSRLSVLTTANMHKLFSNFHPHNFSTCPAKQETRGTRRFLFGAIFS